MNGYKTTKEGGIGKVPLDLHRAWPHTRDMKQPLDKDSLADEKLAAAVARRERSEQDLDAAQDAFRHLYERHARILLAFLSARVERGDLEDVHQEIWQRVWKQAPKGFKGGHFRAWLYTIARNYLIDRSRKKKPESLPEGELADPRARTDAILDEQERMEILKHCLDRLGADLASVMRARLAGDSYEEICARSGLGTAQAHKLVYQAKEQLQNCVQKTFP